MKTPDKILPFKIVEQSSGNFFVEGELTFFKLNKKAVTCFEFLQSGQKICIDLQKITVADSAGLALLVEWIKQGQLYATKLTFKNIPQQLIILAKLNGFDLNTFLQSNKD